MTKRKVLLLGTHDSKLAGHIQHTYNQIKDQCDAVMVTRFGFYGKASHCYWPLGGRGLSLWEKIRYFRFSRSFFILWRYLFSFLRTGSIPIIDRKHREYCFADYEFLPYSAKDILKKCPDGFIPDIIWVGWSSRFVSTKIIHDLYKFTGAIIVYCFVDEAPLTGGCHYPNECLGYLNGCNNCPALSCGKKIPAIQMQLKKQNLKDIPLCLIGTPYDLRMAKNTELFKNASFFPGIDYPTVTITPQNEARVKLGVPKEKYVVLVGAASLNDTRKGFIYSIESINLANRHINDLFVLVIGRTNEQFKLNFPNVDLLELGFVDIDRMVLAYCAADCFLSTTIADSGPQMVNYSIATGTPVVSFSMGIAQDLVLHKETGYIAKFKDAEDVAEGIRYLYTLDECQRDKMSKRCISLIKEKSSVGGWQQLLLDIE